MKIHENYASAYGATVKYAFDWVKQCIEQEQRRIVFCLTYLLCVVHHEYSMIISLEMVNVFVQSMFSSVIFVASMIQWTICKVVIMLALQTKQIY